MTEAGNLAIVEMMTRVLIIDDQIRFCRQMGELLRRAGMQVVGEAGDIPSAESIAQAELPDLAIVDVMLPGINGIEGVPLLRRSAPHMRILLVSAYQDQFSLMQEAARHVGADGFLGKDELDVERIKALLERPKESLEKDQ